MATSTTKTDAKAVRKAFVTLRFAGDDLDPAEISAILPVAPTRAHKKGEEFVAGPHAGKLRGRTGIWFLATDHLVASDDLGEHLKFIEELLYSKAREDSRIRKLLRVLERAHSHANVTCFWRGQTHETVPEIPAQFSSLIGLLAGEVETDFSRESGSTDGNVSDGDDAPTTSLMNQIVKWIKSISTPEFKQFNRKKIAYALADDFEYKHGLVSPFDDFCFGEPIDTQHRLVMSYLYLNQAVNVLSQTGFYFRRYPFRSLAVTREDHARNICEFYFSQFYIIESRLKECLDRLKKDASAPNIDVGRIVKLFKQEFDRELRMRNGLTHHEPFDDVDLSRLFLTRIMSDSPDLIGKSWDREHLWHYRKFATLWSKRAKKRAADMQVYLEAVAVLMLRHASFLPQ